MNWIKIKEDFPEAFDVFKYHENNKKVTTSVAWDVVDRDFASIGKKYHEEWIDLCWCHYNNNGSLKYVDDEKFFDERNLFDFFDKYGFLTSIRGEINYHQKIIFTYAIDSLLPKNKWLWHGTEDLEPGEKDYPIQFRSTEMDFEDYDTRHECENVAFTKAFEILNNEIKNGNIKL